MSWEKGTGLKKKACPKKGVNGQSASSRVTSPKDPRAWVTSLHDVAAPQQTQRGGDLPGRPARRLLRPLREQGGARAAQPEQRPPSGPSTPHSRKNSATISALPLRVMPCSRLCCFAIGTERLQGKLPSAALSASEAFPPPDSKLSTAPSIHARL